MTIKDEYLKREKSIAQSITVLESILKGIRDDFNRHPDNWEYVESVGYIDGKLKELVESFT